MSTGSMAFFDQLVRQLPYQVLIQSINLKYFWLVEPLCCRHVDGSLQSNGSIMALEAAYNQMAFVQFFCTSPTFHFLALDQYSGGSLSIQKRGCATWPKWPDDCKQSVNFLLIGRIHPFPTLRKIQTSPNLLNISQNYLEGTMAEVPCQLT